MILGNDQCGICVQVLGYMYSILVYELFLDKYLYCILTGIDVPNFFQEGNFRETKSFEASHSSPDKMRLTIRRIAREKTREIINDDSDTDEKSWTMRESKEKVSTVIAALIVDVRHHF